MIRQPDDYSRNLFDMAMENGYKLSQTVDILTTTGEWISGLFIYQLADRTVCLKIHEEGSFKIIEIAGNHIVSCVRNYFNTSFDLDKEFEALH